MFTSLARSPSSSHCRHRFGPAEPAAVSSNSRLPHRTDPDRPWHAPAAADPATGAIDSGAAASAAPTLGHRFADPPILDDL